MNRLLRNRFKTLLSNDQQNEAEIEFNWLLKHANSFSRSVISRDMRLSKYINDRFILHKPLQYILGTQPFASLEIKVRRPVLIPRPETEEWTLWLIRELNRNTTRKVSKIVDLCSGSGCISLALAHHLTFNRCHVLNIVGVDSSKSAFNLSMINKRNLPFNNTTINSTPLITLEYRICDLFHNDINDIISGADLIVSNPPYVSTPDFHLLDKTVKDWEDPGALIGTQPDNSSGLLYYHRLADLFHTHFSSSSLRSSSSSSGLSSGLSSGDTPLTTTPRVDLVSFSNYHFDDSLPLFVVEIGNGQCDQVLDIFIRRGFKRFKVFLDFQGIKRVIAGFHS